MSDKNINQMDFKELRKEVQSLRDELAIMQRKYEDILYNLDDENFSSQFIKERDGMKAELKITAEAISTKVSSEEVESMITQTAKEIKSEVYNEMDSYSTISQTNDKISMVVSKSVSAKFTMSKKPTISNTTDEEKGMICEYNGTSYYYNNISKTWVECPYEDEIKSFFEQTSDGFNLIGDVSVSGKIMATDNDESYSQMSEAGFGVWIEGLKKIEIGSNEVYEYIDGEVVNSSYPYVILGAGINEEGRNRGCICKLGRGIWVGDASIADAGGNYPGDTTKVTDIFDDYPQATGIFIDLNSGVVWQYNQGTPQHI